MFENITIKVLILLINCVISNHKKISNDLTEAQLVLLNRIKASKYINNPYKNLNASQGILK